MRNEKIKNEKMKQEKTKKETKCLKFGNNKINLVFFLQNLNKQF